MQCRSATVTVVVPAHNEEETVAEVVEQAARGLTLVGVVGEVIVAASGCTDSTAERAESAGARVVEAPAGKGKALNAGVKAAHGDIVCLVDGDFRYYGEVPISAVLIEPILQGVAEATIADLYWRPLYPQMWLNGFFVPMAGHLYPEILPKVGTTPWSGQRAVLRSHWPDDSPDDFTVDLSLLLDWNESGVRMRPVICDDWTNPQRPKPDLIGKEFELLVQHA
ncbi:glycosyltransferase family 2 protein [Streptomyces sp. NPDC005525]|uniref:glycosyltransferase family 2 protein n=1 Tax=Streptomyces sp. NPDC005525 TaxID=3364720 RepID=UPI00368832EB